MPSIVIVAHNLRSSHNVGSLLRTAEGLGVKTVYFTGYTPYPIHKQDERLPHIARKVHNQISKTALGAETSQHWQVNHDIFILLNQIAKKDYVITALEQTKSSVELHTYKPPQKIALIIGNEVSGIEKTILDKVSIKLEIPMLGKKESFNVVQATAMALFHLTFNDKI